MERHQHAAGQWAGEGMPVTAPHLGFRGQSISLLSLLTEAVNYNWRVAQDVVAEEAA